MRTMVVSGFEPSGHDAVATALWEEGASRGHDVVVHNWGSIFPEVARHPLFNLPRICTMHGVPELAVLLDEKQLWNAIVTDFVDHINLTGFDVIICVHLWSTMIVAEKLKSADLDSKLIDVSGEFSRFPVVINDRVDAYVGGGSVAPLPPKIRGRCHSLGVPVRQGFISHGKEARKEHLVVSSGTDGWSSNQLAKVLPKVVRALNPRRVLLLAPNATSRAVWEKAISAAPDQIYEIKYRVTDISGLLRNSRWFLTKASGPGAAEGFAAGCELILAATGVFWEDDARSDLLSLLAATPVDVSIEDDELAFLARRGASNRKLLAERCIQAAASVWQLIEEGCPQRNVDANDLTIVGSILSRLSEGQGESPLNDSVRMFAGLLEDWI